MGDETFDDWQRRVDAVWRDPALSDEQRIDRIDALAAERGDDDAVALFERAGARDSAGREGEAEPLYRRALEAGLDEERRVRTIIQLASTVRNLGRPDESLRLLQEELAGGEALRDEVAAFTALALVAAGDPVRAASVALTALAPHLTLYTRSVRAYAAELASG